MREYSEEEIQDLTDRVFLAREQFQAGKVHFAALLADDFFRSFEAIRLRADGKVDPRTVDGRIRTFTLAMVVMRQREDAKKAMSLADIQSAYFDFLFQQFGAFQHRHAMLFGQGAGGVLEAEYPQLFRRWADKGDTGGLAGFSKGGVFREKTVTGVDRGGAALFGHGENLLDHQVGVGCRAFAQAVRFVGLLDMQAGGVCFGVDGHALYIKGA